MPEVHPGIEGLAYQAPELECYPTGDGELVVYEVECQENWIKGSAVEARR